MQLILIQDVPHLGSLGDEVQVKNGYARNFLLPRGMAIVAGSRKTSQVDHQKKRLEGLRAEAIERAKSESEKVAELEFAVKAKAGANGRLFGSVTSRDILAIFTEYGYTLDRRSILLHTPIRNVGNFGATVKLHTDVKVDIVIKVEPMTGEAGAEAAEGTTEGDGAEAAEGTTEEAGAEAATTEAATGETADGTVEEAGAEAATTDAAGGTAEGADADGAKEGAETEGEAEPA
ncbi:MAG: 50S ribosomal protein L9 [bacterium]